MNKKMKEHIIAMMGLSLHKSLYGTLWMILKISRLRGLSRGSVKGINIQIQ